jgi:dUTP pyrophosphatase
MSKLILKFKRLSETAKLPSKNKKTDAGWDLYADESKTIFFNSKELVTTNLAYEIPAGYALIIKDRSSMATKGITTNAGTCDADYRGTVKVLIRNNNSENFEIKKGDKIAQFLVVEVPECEIEEVSELNTTERGSGGWGSSGR